MIRIKFAFLFFLLGFAGVAFRLFDTQVLDHDHFRRLAEAQQLRADEIPAERGKIYSSGGVLAANEEAYLVFANPQEVEDARAAAGKIAPILLEDPRFFSYNLVPGGTASPKEYLTARIEELLSKEDKRWVLLARKIPAQLVQRLRDSEIAGLGFQTDPRRFYPEGSLAASVLGFVAFDENGKDQGYNGLEGYYDGDLRGKAGRLVRSYSSDQNPILVGEVSSLEAQNGADLYLTVNRGIQSILDQKIEEGVKRYDAKSGSFVVLEPSTGKILAMGNYPRFDPGNFNPYVSPSKKSSKWEPEFRNTAVASAYEPGSVMKPVTIASALEVGAIDPSWTFNDSGPLKIGAATINTWDGQHWNEQTLSQLLQKSNNIGAALVAQETGAEALRSYFLNFGFGSQLGIDLEGEEAGLVKPLKEWRAVDLATAGFGQGIAITPLHLASAYATIANGGVMMKPYLVEQIADRSGREVRFSPQPVRRVVSEKTADVVTELIRSAVEGGESVILRGIEYRVAGKTGTAQIPVGGKYDPNKTNVTFVGFPFKDKSFVMVIRLEEPSSSTFSATTVVPLWVEAFRQIAPLMGVLPDR